MSSFFDPVSFVQIYLLEDSPRKVESATVQKITSIKFFKRISAMFSSIGESK